MAWHDSHGAAATPGFWRRFMPVWAAGAVGVLALVLQSVPEALTAQGTAQGLSPATLRLLVLLQPMLLMTALAAAGAAVAHRVGLGSVLAGTWSLRAGSLRRVLATSLIVGVALGLVLALLDWVTAPALGPAWQASVEQANRAPAWPALVVGLLYGGLAEEVMMRWGVMSLVICLLARLTGRGVQLPGHAHYMAGIFLAALAFAAGHLPALAMMVDLTPTLVSRTLTLNAVAGLVYGVLFWRNGLEAAMAAHAGSHLGLALARLVA